MSSRHILIIAGIAVALGVGLAGCSKTAEERAAAAPAKSSPTVAEAAKTTGQAAAATGEAAARAMSDTWITTKIKSVLLADAEAKGLDVKIDTKDGVVTLQGELMSQAAVDHVKALAVAVEGVRQVNVANLTVARR